MSWIKYPSGPSGDGNGYGECRWDNGDVYKGQIKDNKKHGQGTFTWADGRKYVGEWRDNKMHGQTSAGMEDYSGEKQPEKVKLLMGGYWGVGKTALLMTHAYGEFPEDWAVFDNYVSPHLVPTADAITTVNLELCDYHSYTGGPLGAPDRLRPLHYPQTNVHVLCFSVVGPASFAVVKSVFSKELARYSPGVPVLLVGTKLDLRSDEPALADLKQKGLAPITFEQGAELAKQLGYVAYRECSALTQEGVKDVFDTAMKAGLMHADCVSIKRKRRCALM